MKYRKKPVVIEAIKFISNNIHDVIDFIGVDNIDEWGEDYIVISTLEGEIKASVGDYIIRGVVGEYYPCKPDIFDKTYELIEE